MDYIVALKKYGSLLAIPFTWLAYYTDYNTKHVHEAFKDLSPVVPDSLEHGVEVFATMLLVAGVVLLLDFGCCYLNAVFSWEPLYPVMGYAFLCFGVVAPFKSMSVTPFKEVNIFWHLASLAAGFHIFATLRQVNDMLYAKCKNRST